MSERRVMSVLGFMRLTVRQPRVVACVAAAILVTGANPGLADPNYRFHFPLTEDSSLASKVFHITQDDRGLIWFAYGRNLERYDGIRLLSVETPRGSGLTALTADRAGNLWLGTTLHGLQIWDPSSQAMRTWQPAGRSSALPSHVTALAVGTDGALWVGSPDAGLTVIDADRGTTYHYPPGEIDPDGAGSLPIESLMTDGRGNLWVGSTEGRVFRLEPGSRQISQVDLEGDARVDALVGESEWIWAGTSRGSLARIGRDSLEAEIVVRAASKPNLSDTGPILALSADPHGRLWVGTERGLKLFSSDGLGLVPVNINPDRAGEPSSDAVHALYLDRSAVMWIADDGGVTTATTRASAFQHWRIDHRRTNPPVTAVAADDDGSLWVGTFRAGLFRRSKDGAVERFGRPDAILSPPANTDLEDPSRYETSAMSLLIDRNSDLWIGTLRRGLARLDRETGAFTNYLTDPDDPTTLSNPTVTVIANRRDGTLWVGTFAGGLNLFDPLTGTFSALRHDPDDDTSLSEDQVRAVLEDSKGRLWVGSRSQGLSVRFPYESGFRRFRNDPDDPTSLAHDSIVAISEDSEGRIWLGTYRGLHRALIDGDRISFERFGREEGLLGRKIFSILEDGDGFLWLSSSRGISKFDPEERTFVNLGLDHGLPPLGFNFGAYAMSDDGRLHYGSNYGVTSFDPKETVLAPYTPEIILAEVTKAEVPTDFEPGGTVTLSHTEGFISFEFSLLDFVATDQNRYEHFLEGFDDDWVDLGNHQRATYSNLPAGSYTFRVRGANSEGIWSAAEARLSVEVLPPPWASWWAYSIYAVSALGLVLAYARAQSRKQRRETIYTQRLEREVHIRTRELAEQNEKLRYANELLEVASVTDSLTGVRNRRFLLTTIDQDIALVDRAFATDREGRENAAFVFILFDLDGFKEINDSFGHSAGDLVLYQVRDLLTQARRTSDTLVRWGGDEFLIVAREATREHVETLVERIRQSVAAHHFDIGASSPVRLTCSLGFACYPFVADNPKLYSWEEVVDIADRALYVAKRHGPNMWAGIFGTERTQETPSEDLLTLILERPELLSDEGSIRLVTSHRAPYEVRSEPESQHA